MIARDDITGLILAGGRGSRMGGTDKGLQPLHGTPMAMHTMMRLTPQVGGLMINANRNLAAYESFGVPVYTDSVPDFAGPLAGMLAGLEQCATPWMVTAPCDSPFLPTDLVARLAQAIEAEGAELAIPVTLDQDGRRQTQPVFCLMPVSALDSLVAYLSGGGRKIETWAASHRLAEVLFDDAAAFANINTLDELRAHEAR
ncbi:molybdopterin-guanine dinucleotide biosynthesis protein A [Cupriavidus taiwanensis]|uniref:molybdenum cofactor guanylyltransferase MobA n=1 Tax=Cupriavidus taiwanensis TaxID=164546 RepID=UPI000E1B324B|nr:molybdenum cofactor guanylyltransferase MobA [Cupriavidus taiwanensis]SOZ13590.1 molybdopterin-guanine dinucleotide biosynthesis protein A [Cupriavidus taiwanensis]SOZ23823.1 molybdopterin-guanine dinucleotide biosynthesis protein A [Cupriavidus taiwanensis]SOZ44198.1 molybdopterin-guanine dinucleotide biosynthesis protein A [Cupriavidus taiwanensis]SOZ98168.1 molybdopterin-guanine dinucleotide biosynthesis protein A [Cupriavidus taiwanensis]